MRRFPGWHSGCSQLERKEVRGCLEVGFTGQVHWALAEAGGRMRIGAGRPLLSERSV